MNSTTISAVILRVAIGWLMFLTGIKKVLDPDWTATHFLLNAKTFPAFYAWLAEPQNIWWVDPLNAWGLTLIGATLLLGIFIRPAALAGVLLMILYYFPGVDFPYTAYGYIVETHIIYAAAFMLIAVLPHARAVGLGGPLRRTSFGKLRYIRPFV